MTISCISSFNITRSRVKIIFDDSSEVDMNLCDLIPISIQAKYIELSRLILSKEKEDSPRKVIFFDYSERITACCLADKLSIISSIDTTRAQFEKMLEEGEMVIFLCQSPPNELYLMAQIRKGKNIYLLNESNTGTKISAKPILDKRVENSFRALI